MIAPKVRFVEHSAWEEKRNSRYAFSLRRNNPFPLAPGGGSVMLGRWLAEPLGVELKDLL